MYRTSFSSSFSLSYTILIPFPPPPAAALSITGYPILSAISITYIIEAASITGADSIHPGFGFLSENSRFAKICEESNIKFIGPSYKVIDLMHVHRT